VPDGAVVPGPVVEDGRAGVISAVLEAPPVTRVLAQQHFAEDGATDPPPPGAAWRPRYLASRATVKVAAPTVWMSAGTPVNDVNRLSRNSLRRSASGFVRGCDGWCRLWWRVQTGTTALSHRVARVASPSRSVPFSAPARVLRKSCTNANPPGAGRTPYRAVAGQPEWSERCCGAVIFDL
jgi:hypothetical protein